MKYKTLKENISHKSKLNQTLVITAEDILNKIKSFFSGIFEISKNNRGYKYASYKKDWLDKLELNENDADEAKYL